MSANRAIPTIGMTLAARPVDPRAGQRADRIAAQYRDAVAHHGARVVEIRPADGPAALIGLNGLLLTGGGDINPQRYGQEPHPKAGPADDALDELEIAVARAALADSVPILGICRGAQVLGVALGGQLVQDVGSELSLSQEHRTVGRARATRHWVELASGSRLAQLIGARRICVNSFHHQANSRLGPGVVRSAWCEDGVTEAIEVEGAAFAIGVQWHPERMWRRAPRQRRLLAAFVAACRQH